MLENQYFNIAHVSNKCKGKIWHLLCSSHTMCTIDVFVLIVNYCCFILTKPILIVCVLGLDSWRWLQVNWDQVMKYNIMSFLCKLLSFRLSLATTEVSSASQPNSHGSPALQWYISFCLSKGCQHHRMEADTPWTSFQFIRRADI